MITAKQLAAWATSKVPMNEALAGITPESRLADAITARDAEHRAELAAAQRTIEQLGKDGAAMAAENERLKGELAEATSILRAWAWFAGEDKKYEITGERTRAFLAAPPPAESTPVHEYVSSRTGACMECGKAIGERPPHLPKPAPPDGIRERLDDHERRLAALEAKGEPGTHPCDCQEGYCQLRSGLPLTAAHPVHCKGAKP